MKQFNPFPEVSSRYGSLMGRRGDNPANLQAVWEQLNGALYDLEHGTPADAIPAIEDCIERLESMGVGEVA